MSPGHQSPGGGLIHAHENFPGSSSLTKWSDRFERPDALAFAQ